MADISRLSVRGDFTDEVKAKMMELRPLVDEIVGKLRAVGDPEGLIPVRLMILIAALSEEAVCMSHLNPFEGVQVENFSAEPERE